jgi:hypothetical protein
MRGLVLVLTCAGADKVVILVSPTDFGVLSAEVRALPYDHNPNLAPSGPQVGM